MLILLFMHVMVGKLCAKESSKLILFEYWIYNLINGKSGQTASVKVLFSVKSPMCEGVYT